MKVYFGGCERPNSIHTMAKAGGRRVMISYAEPPTEACWQLYREYGIEIMADSGAYSMWQRGLELDIAAYMEWLTDKNISNYFNMDIVGDPMATASNQAIMETAGYKPIPVFHHGESWEILQGMVERYELVGIGGTVGLTHTQKVTFFRELFSRFPAGRFHGLGLANTKLLKQFPFESTDSIWWLWKWRKNKRLSGDGVCRKIEQTARVRHLLGLQHREREYQKALF